MVKTGYFRMTDDGGAELAHGPGFVPGKNQEFAELWTDEARRVARSVRAPLWLRPLLFIASVLWKRAGKPPVSYRTRWGRALRWLQGHEVRVSTVFLVIDHNYGTSDEPVLWETMVFGSRRFAEFQERHSSLPDALLCHALTVAKVFPFPWFRPETEYGECVSRFRAHRARELFTDTLRQAAS